MDSDKDVLTLVEMGFSREQAIEALSATGNDVPSAIAHLFGDVQEPVPAEPRRAVPPTLVPESVLLNNPQDVPKVFPRYPSYATECPSQDMAAYSDDWNANEATMKVSEETNFIHIEDQENSMASMSLEASLIVDSLDSEPQVSLPPNIKSKNHLFPMIFTEKKTHKCWIPLISILATYSPFAKAVLEASDDSHVVKQLQRIVYFINNFSRSKRWYIDASSIASAIPSGPNYQYMDEEVVLHMLEELMTAVPSLHPVLESFIEGEEDDVRKELLVLEIDSDSRYLSLYQTLNELFWQKDYSLLGRVKYETVAPVITFQLISDEDAYTSSFELEDTLYPEIYSDKCVVPIMKQIESIKRAQTAQHVLNRKLMNFKFFKGENIDEFLKTTKQVLEGPAPAASEDIQALMSQLQNARTSELSKQETHKEEASSERLRLFDKVLLTTPDLRAYSLIGVIISESKYYVRQGNQWIHMEECDVIDFDEVKDVVREVTRRGPHVVTLIYVESSQFGDVEFIENAPELKSADSARKESDLLSDEDLIDLRSQEDQTAPCQAESPKSTPQPQISCDSDRTEDVGTSPDRKNWKISVSAKLARKFKAEEEAV